MVLDDRTTKAGLLQECEFWVFGADYGAITNNTNYLNQFIHLINEGLNKVTLKIINSDTRWQWDDANHTDFPIAETTLTSGQQDYELEFSATDTHMKIQRVEAKDENGNYYRLIPFDLADVDTAQSELYETDGKPKYYDKIGNSIFLYPAPDYTQASSLKVFYQREPSYFSKSDRTKRPGIPTPFHRLISLYASHDYTLANGMYDKAQFIEREVVKMEEELQTFYNKRDVEDKPKLAVKLNSFK